MIWGLKLVKYASMKPSVLKLQKFFKLEAERDYDNRAVLGGLESMLGPWEAEARADGLPDELIEAVIARLRDYHRLSESSRQEALHGLWRRIQRRMGTETQPLPPLEEERQEEAEPTLEEAEQAEAEPTPEETASPRSKRREEAPKKRSGPKAGERKPSPASAAVKTEEAPAALSAPITVLSGIGPRHAQTLSRLSLNSLGDMLYFLPRRYDDYTQLKQINRLVYGEEVTVIGTVQSVYSRQVRNGRTTLTEALISDGSGTLKLTWFNQPWIAKRLHNHMQVVVSGKIDQYLGRLVMNSPELEPIDTQNLHTNRIVPVYPLTANITQRWLRRMMHQVVTYWAPRIQDPLPEDIRRSASLVDLPNAVLQAHFPDSWEELKAARQRLAFDEIFLLQLGLLEQKRAWQEREARVFGPPEDWVTAQVARLPFRLTEAQSRVLNELLADLSSGRPMNRLLQGDVGSGKTVIAGLAIALVAREGAQAAMMAPTSILAEQHYRSLLRLLTGAGGVLEGSQIRLMIGATPESEKQMIREGLESGEIKVVVGTHALIEEPVAFKDLQLAVVDEQHRFGVEQRGALRDKGHNPHLLVMTATPIPRSLALTVYGDLDLSVMDEMPPGRQPVATHVLSPIERERAYSLVQGQIEQGHQAFIIYPLVEENEKRSEEVAGGPPAIAGKAAVDEYRRLREDVFHEYSLGLLHGRLRPDEKDEVMAGFRDGEYDVLVATSVVEVGVDVPNATVMLIEGANRFGLAQLHQFRGRVGRGGDKAYCLLIPESEDALENERLAAMAETTDGFVLAEKDLEQRGPGEFLGTRQSGFTELRLATLTNVHLIEKARRLARSLFDQDPYLEEPEHHLLAATLERFWGEMPRNGIGEVS
jgi:ATP-dependent DNA helicase RecG